MSMKISKKELQDLIAEEIKKSVEEGIFDKLKKGFDFLTKGRAIDPEAATTGDEKKILDKTVDFQQDLDKEVGDVKTALGKASEEMMDVLKTAKATTDQLGELSRNFVHGPADEQSQKVASDLEKFIVGATELNMAYKKHLRDFSELRFAIDPEADVSKFKLDPTATMKMIGRTRAGRGAPDDSKRGKMFAKESKELRKTVKEEVYKALLNKVKK